MPLREIVKILNPRDEIQPLRLPSTLYSYIVGLHILYKIVCLEVISQDYPEIMGPIKAQDKYFVTSNPPRLRTDS